MAEKIEAPKGWKEVDFGNLIKEQSKSKIQVSDASNHGDYPFFTSGEKVLLHDDYLIEGKNLFLSTGGIANVKFYEGKCAYSTDTYAIFVHRETSTKYLYYYLQDKLYFINSNYFLGSGLKHLQKKDLKKHKLLTPKDVLEQKEITKILTKVDETISQTEQLIAKYERIKTGLMQDLLTKGIDENGSIRNEKTHRFKDSPLGRIPIEWEIDNPENLFDMILGKMLNKDAKSGTNQFPFLSNKDIQWGFVNTDNLQLMSFDLRERTKYQLKPGDLLVCEGGDVGRSALWTLSDTDIFFQKAVHRLRAKTNEMLPEFMFEFMRVFVTKPIFNDYISQTSIKHFTQEKFKQIPIIKPEIIEQKRILKYAEKVSESISENVDVFSKLQKQKKGLMQDLLSGKKRVTPLLNTQSV